ARRHIALEADHAHAESLGEPRQTSADAAEPDDDQRLAAELVLPLRQVGDHAAPGMLRLVVARLREATRHRQNERHCVLGHSVDVDALRTGEPNAATIEHGAIELIGAGADGLNEMQLARALGELVAPQPRNHQHVGLTDARLELFARGHAEAFDRQLAQHEALLQLVGDVSKADGELALRGKHRLAPKGCDQKRLARNGVRSMPGRRPATRSASSMPVMPEDAMPTWPWPKA